MKRIAAHYVYSGAGIVLPKQVIGLDENNCVVSIQPLRDETASTIFLNGLLCPAFSLPGDSNVLSTGDAMALLKRVTQSEPLMTIPEILDLYTSTPDLKIGSKVVLWCIEPIDLKKLVGVEDTVIYSVLP